MPDHLPAPDDRTAEAPPRRGPVEGYALDGSTTEPAPVVSEAALPDGDTRNSAPAVDRDRTATRPPSDVSPGATTPSSRPTPTAGPPITPPPGYELLGILGHGGMGVVYKARQTALKREVALKVLIAGGHASDAQRQRFLAEAEAVAAVNHPGVVQVHDFGTWEGQPYLSLEFCPGGTLAQKLNGTPLPPREAADVVERLALAVAAAHAKGIVHRDLKPQNVLLDAAGAVKVTDFGLAKLADSTEGLTATGAVMGTPAYMSPEQARGDTKAVGLVADVYALGAILYECLTGRPPFRGSSTSETIQQVLHQEPVAVRALNPTVPVDLQTVCLMCLEKDIARRYASAAALSDDLRAFLDGRPVVARPVGPVGRARKWVARNPVVAALLTAVVMAVAAGTGGTYAKYRDARDEAKAKEDALASLEITFGDLKMLSDKQAATVQLLEQEKVATENALLRGLLRPLHDRALHADCDQPIALDVSASLTDLSDIADERVRTRAVEVGFALSGGARRLSAWRKELVFAIVGVDPSAAARLRVVVGGRLVRPGVDKNVQLACALWVAELPPGVDALDVTAARVVADHVAAERDPNTAIGLAEALSTLGSRLKPDDAGAVIGLGARAVTDRLATAKDARDAVLWAEALSALGRRLRSTDAAPLARAVTDRLAVEEEFRTLPRLAEALSALGHRLGPSEAAPLARAAAGRILASGDANPEGSMAEARSALALAVLGGRLGRSEAAPLARALADRLAVSAVWREPSVVDKLVRALAALAGRLGPAEAGEVRPFTV